MEGYSRTLTSSIIGLLVLCANAQNSVDITLVPGQDNDLEVRVRFENDYDGYFAASVFTVRWSESSGASLGTLEQDGQVQMYHSLGVSGAVHTDGGFFYQVYAGFGAAPLSDIPLTLGAGEWITLCRIPVSGTIEGFSISDDAFTASVNGTYYISLGGQESQGAIIDTDISISGSQAADRRFLVYPSVTSGLITVETDLQVDSIRLSVTNLAGQEFLHLPVAGTDLSAGRSVDLSRVDAGMYIVRWRSSDGAHAARVVKH